MKLNRSYKNAKSCKFNFIKFVFVVGFFLFLIPLPDICDILLHVVQDIRQAVLHARTQRHLVPG
jgi:hypothetical protein